MFSLSSRSKTAAVEQLSSVLSTATWCHPALSVCLQIHRRLQHLQKQSRIVFNFSGFRPPCTHLSNPISRFYDYANRNSTRYFYVVYNFVFVRICKYKQLTNKYRWGIPTDASAAMTTNRPPWSTMPSTDSTDWPSTVSASFWLPNTSDAVSMSAPWMFSVRLSVFYQQVKCCKFASNRRFE